MKEKWIKLQKEEVGDYFEDVSPPGQTEENTKRHKGESVARSRFESRNL